VAGPLKTYWGGQLRLNVPRLAVFAGPRFLRCIDIESSAQAEVVRARRVGRYSVAARARVGRNQKEPKFCRNPLGTRLDGEIFRGAGQTRQIPHDRNLLPIRLWWDEGRKLHGGSRFGRSVPVSELCPVEAT